MVFGKVCTLTQKSTIKQQSLAQTYQASKLSSVLTYVSTLLKTIFERKRVKMTHYDEK